MAGRSVCCPVWLRLRVVGIHEAGDDAGSDGRCPSVSLGRQAIHRMAEREDIAGSVLVLAAEDAGWITGQTIMADGGNAFGL